MKNITLPEQARILVVQTNRLGDCILAEPCLRLIRRCRPKARLDVLHGLCPGVGIFERLDEVELAFRWDSMRENRGVIRRVLLYRTMKRARYDAAIFRYSGASPLWLVLAAGIPARVAQGGRSPVTPPWLMPSRASGRAWRSPAAQVTGTGQPRRRLCAVCASISRAGSPWGCCSL